MKLEDQVCSLELAKRLKELGVNQDAFWHYAPDDQGTFNDLYMTGQTPMDISAFSVAELGEMLSAVLPKSYVSSEFFEGCVVVEICAPSKEWHKVGDALAVSEKTEADARALMLIHLIENNLLSPKQIPGKLGEKK